MPKEHHGATGGVAIASRCIGQLPRRLSPKTFVERLSGKAAGGCDQNDE
jgi:hypothetical protein